MQTAHNKMELVAFEMGFGGSEVNINGTCVSCQQAVLIALHILEYVGKEWTVTDLALVKRDGESEPQTYCKEVDSSPSIG
jgi:hypothetical protein